MLRSIAPFVSTLALALSAPVVAQQTEPSWESIDPDLRNVRGMCYLPVYPSLEGTADYYGVASSTAMWHEYDMHPNAIPQTDGALPQGTAGHVYEQLIWLKKMGINTVRIWISFPLWEYHHDNPTGPVNESVLKWRHFVYLCEKLKMYAMPVIWDSLSFQEPDYLDPIGIGNRSAWHCNPGDDRIAGFVAQDPTLAGTKAEAYLLDLMAAFSNSDALLMWDIMNEPHLSPDIHQLITSTMAIIKSNSPSDYTNIGLLWAEDAFPVAAEIARDPNLDSFAIHPYGHTRANIEAHIWDAVNIDDLQGGHLDKPILATEIGKPGWALEYQDALDFAVGVPRPDIGPGETGIGFTPWTAMIGWAGGQFPFKETDGIFWGDGLVREKEVVEAFMQVARSQGVPTDQLWDREDIIEYTGTGRVVQDLPIHVDDWDYLTNLAWMPATQMAQMSWEEFQEACGVFRMVSFFIDVGPLSHADNPVNDPTIPGNVISPTDLGTMLFMLDFLCPPNEPGFITEELRLIMTSILGEPFMPETNAIHRTWLTGGMLDQWRLALLPYLVLRQGPY